MTRNKYQSAARIHYLKRMLDVFNNPNPEIVQRIANNLKKQFLTRKENKMYWVTMTDKFLSGWGEAASKINKLVIECSNLAEALIIATNASHRHEMKYINIRRTKPRYDPSRYTVSYKTLEQCQAWRIPQPGWS